jgi:hypothetical protein
MQTAKKYHIKLVVATLFHGQLGKAFCLPLKHGTLQCHPHTDEF